MSITILLLGREYALVDKGLPKQGSLLYHPKTMHYRQITQKITILYTVHVCSERFPEKYGSYFCWPQEQLEQTNTSKHGNPAAPWSRWRLPTTSLVTHFRFSNGEHFGHHISTGGRMYIYIRIFTYHIYIDIFTYHIYYNIVYMLSVYVLY